MPSLRPPLLAALVCLALPGVATAQQWSDVAGTNARGERIVEIPARHLQADSSVGLIVELRSGSRITAGRSLTSDGRTVSLSVRAASAEGVLASLRRDPAVAHAERDGQLHFSAPREGVTDPLGSQQWALERIGWYDVPEGAPAAPVTLLDSGIEAAHPEFGPLADGRPKLAATWNAMTSNSDASDYLGHGTATASIVGALSGNGAGIVGVAPSVQLTMVKVGQQGVRTSDAIRGLDWAVANGASVVNMSFGTTEYSKAFRNAILRARSKGVVLVAAAGNSGCAAEGGGNEPEYPAAFPHVIAVAASNRNDGIACFSNHGTEVDIAAPGVGVLAAVQRGELPETMQDPSGYATSDGTSLAAPMVAAAAALIRGQHPDWTPDQVEHALTSTARDVGKRGWDGRSGAGILNIGAALRATTPAPADFAESNDDILFARQQPAISFATGAHLGIEASVDRRDDLVDVYRVSLRKGQRVKVRLAHAAGSNLQVMAWNSQATTIFGSKAHVKKFAIGFSRSAARVKTISFRATRSGDHFVQVWAKTGGGRYRLSFSR